MKHKHRAKYVDMSTLYDALDGARLVVVDEDRGVIAVWHGGATINLYNEALEAVDCYTMGRGGEAEGRTASEVQADIIEWLAAQDEEDR